MPGGKTQAPTLPIQIRTSPAAGSPRSRRNRNHVPAQAKAWADITPTPWLDHTPTPWSTLASVAEFGGPFVPPIHGVMPTPANAQESIKGDNTLDQSKYWPATPTPSAGVHGQNMMYGFGESMPGPPPMGLPLQPPPMLAAMAAAAAGAAGAAAAAASASLGGDGSPSPLDASPMATLGPDSTIEQAMTSFGPNQAQLYDGGDHEEEVPHNLPSRGSALHGTGKCRPCAWFWKAQGCQNAQECGYCHLCPEGELRSRKKSKVAAMRMGALAPAKPGNTTGLIRTLKLTPLV
mmetsp:Transcript_19001/g.53581  ORF Transcript_19001/g.53581 Transcript_19001/m.53581 type:complete len:291 (-) Transcript_19001:204-1076(-)